jgi:hypothetical protein
MDIDEFKQRLSEDYIILDERINSCKLFPGKEETIEVISALDIICLTDPKRTLPKSDQINYIFRSMSLKVMKTDFPAIREILMEYRGDFQDLLDKYIALEREAEETIQMELLSCIFDEKRNPTYCSDALMILPDYFPQIEYQSKEVRSKNVLFVENGKIKSITDGEEVTIDTIYVNENCWRSKIRLAQQFPGDVFNISGVSEEQSLIHTIIPLLERKYLNLCYNDIRN